MMVNERIASFFNWFDPFFLWYFSAINFVYALLLLLGSIYIYSRRKEISIEDFTRILNSNSLPEITMIIPFYNESEYLLKAIENILNLSYRYKQIIAVNDGSEDDSLEILKEKLELVEIPQFFKEPLPTQRIRAVYQSKSHRDIIILDKEHGTKFDANNAGINACTNPYFICIDADTIIDDIGFQALIRPILSSPDTVAVGAAVRINDGCKLVYNKITTERFPTRFLAMMQALEYIRSFQMRQGWNYLGGNFVVAGAFSVFPRNLIVNIGGYSPTVAEDMEIVVRLHRIMKKAKLPYKVIYLPDPVAWTSVPDTVKALAYQRGRWHRGLLETLWYHKAMCCNPQYGFFGFFNYPFWIWGEGLEPVIEALGFLVIIIGWILGFLNTQFFILLLGISLGFSILYTLTCVLIEELSFKKYTSLRTLIIFIIAALMENFGYRQMTLWWRLQGTAGFFMRFKEVRKETRLIDKYVKKSLKKGKLR